MNKKLICILLIITLFGCIYEMSVNAFIDENV